MTRDYNNTERESTGVGQDILISKKLFLFYFFIFEVTDSSNLVDFRKTNFL